MLKVTFEFETAQDAINAIHAVTQHTTAPVTPAKPSGGSKKAKAGGAGAPVSQPAPAAKPAAAEAGSAPAAQAAPPVEALPTLNDVRAALRVVFDTKGAAKATAILRDFGAASVSTVPADKYSAFIEACNNG